MWIEKIDGGAQEVAQSIYKPHSIIVTIVTSQLVQYRRRALSPTFDKNVPCVDLSGCDVND